MLLTIAERVAAGGDLAGRLLVIDERHAITRLGQGVDRSRTLDPEAVRRTLACLEHFRQEASQLGVTRMLCVGTSALRDAAEGAPFVARASRIVGCPVEVVSGAREAELTFRGAISSLDLVLGGVGGSTIDRASPDSRTDALVLAFDVGGGSTEIVLGTADGKVERSTSLNVGSVRLFERHGAESFEDARRALRAVLPPAFASSPSLVIGIAGTMTTLWTLAYGRPFEEGAAASRPLETEAISQAAADLHAMSAALRRDQLGIDPGRADVIPFGALIASEILRWAGAHTVRVTSRGVRYGLLLEALAE